MNCPGTLAWSIAGDGCGPSDILDHEQDNRADEKEEREMVTRHAKRRGHSEFHRGSWPMVPR